MKFVPVSDQLADAIGRVVQAGFEKKITKMVKKRPSNYDKMYLFQPKLKPNKAKGNFRKTTL